MKYFSSFCLDKCSNTPIYQQIGNYFYYLIETNQLQPHSKLPPIRSLANQLKVNTSTIVATYKYLENKGIVYSKVGSGTYVMPLSLKYFEKLKEINLPSFSPTSLQSRESPLLNFASLTPPTHLFPVQDFKRAINDVLDRDLGDAFSSEDPKGYVPLRETLCQWMQRTQINTSVDQIQITSGIKEGIAFLSQTLLQCGDFIFVETPTDPQILAIFQSRGAKTVEIPMEKDGIDICFLETRLKAYRPKWVCLMPSYQNPTGVSYSIAKKRKILELAVQYEFYLIELDLFCDLHYVGSRQLTLKALDKSDRVIYIKGFPSMPGLRLGFVSIPNLLCSTFFSTQPRQGILASALLQRSFERYLSLGLWEIQLEKITTFYQLQYQHSLQILEMHLREYIEYLPPGGGLGLWLQLKSSYPMETFYNTLLQKQVVVAPGSLFSLSQDHQYSFRFSFSIASPEEIDHGVKLILETMEDLIK